MADKLPSMHPVTLRTMFVSHLESNIGCENEISTSGDLVGISVTLQFCNFFASLFWYRHTVARRKVEGYVGDQHKFNFKNFV